jgi:hypothetical protein
MSDPKPITNPEPTRNGRGSYRRLIDWFRKSLDLDQGQPGVVVIRPAAYLKAMVTIVWSSFRHPFSSTIIDLSTGREVSPTP